MNPSHTYAAPKPRNYVGIGFVAAVHLAAIYAFSAGMIHAPVRVKEPTVLLPPIPDKPKQPEVLRDPAFKPDKPTFAPVPVPEVPTPPTWQDAPTITPSPVSDAAPVTAVGPTTAAGPTAVPGPAQTAPSIQTPGAVCSVMPKPEMPAVNWAGEAVLQVMATVRGGRVVGTDFRVVQGVLDGKTKRSLQRSVESALAGYQCQGDAMFQQDFAFRLD
jgi:hypothetical protein